MIKYLVATISIALLCNASNAQKSTGVDFYILPMILGEFGAQIDVGNEKALGYHFTYYNPNLGLSKVLLESQLGSGDELELNAHGIIPGFSYTKYPNGDLDGFYYGGLLRYKMALGSVTYKDKYSGGSAYRGVVKADINIHSINLNGMIGYRWVFENNFSLRLGGAIGFQVPYINEVTYTILEEYDYEGYEVVEDLEEALEKGLKGFTKPVTFQLMIGIGFTK